MSNTVDPKHPKSKNYSEDIPDDEDYDYDNDYDSTDVGDSEDVGQSGKAYGTGGANKNYGSQGPGAYGQQGYGYGGTGGPSAGGDFKEYGGNDNSQFLQQLLTDHPGYSYEQASQIYQAKTGEPLSYEDWSYAKQGLGAYDGPYPSKYKGYGQQTGPLSKNYGSPSWLAEEANTKMMQDAQDGARDVKKKMQIEKIKINTILMKILMGDIVGALASYAHLKQQSMNNFSRQVIDKLQSISQARAGVVKKFAMDRPPRSYAGKDPGQAARAQDKAQDYTKRVQFYTQLMNEYQNTERELMDNLQTTFRDSESFWQTYSSFRDEKFKTDDKVLTWR